MPPTTKPTPIALVVCDNIYQEPGGKTALVGLFNSIGAHTFPVTHSRMAVFASMTGVRNKSIAKLEIVHGETDQTIIEAKGLLPVEDDPVGVVDMNFIFNNVVFPESGTYYIRLWGNDHLLLMRPFTVTHLKKKGETGDNA